MTDLLHTSDRVVLSPSSTRRRPRSSSVFFCVVAVGMLATAQLAPALAAPPERVLLVGNSYTRFNMMPQMLQRLSASVGASLHVDVETKSGATLRRQWLKHEARARIQRGGYRFVVLQGHSLRPIDRLPEFEDYGARFVHAALAAGATPVLLETWARSERTRFYRQRESSPHSAREMTELIASAYEALGTREGARVAPVGRAFSIAIAQSPDIELYREDGTHPSWAGSYLSACVLLGTLTQQDPRHASYVPWELDPARAARLRELAAQVLAPIRP